MIEYEDRGYSFLMRFLHWSMAIIMITMIIAGIAMATDELSGGKFPALRGDLYHYHRGMGFVLLILVVVRLVAYRFSTPPSPLPPHVSPAQKFIASSVHFLLYTALILHPLFGWYATNMWGVKNIPIFGLFNLPTLVEKNRELGTLLLEWHGYTGFFITGLIVLHIAAALKHHFVDKDTVLMRMIRG